MILIKNQNTTKRQSHSYAEPNKSLTPLPTRWPQKDCPLCPGNVCQPVQCQNMSKHKTRWRRKEEKQKSTQDMAEDIHFHDAITEPYLQPWVLEWTIVTAFQQICTPTQPHSGGSTEKYGFARFQAATWQNAHWIGIWINHPSLKTLGILGKSGMLGPKTPNAKYAGSSPVHHQCTPLGAWPRSKSKVKSLWKAFKCVKRKSCCLSHKKENR